MEGECEIVLCGGVHFYCTIIVANTSNNPSTCHILWLMGSSLKLSISSINDRGYNMNQNRWILCSRGDLSMGLGVELQMVSIIKKLKIHRVVFTVRFLMYVDYCEIWWRYLMFVVLLYYPFFNYKRAFLSWKMRKRMLWKIQNKPVWTRQRR